MNAVRPATTESALPVAPWPRMKLGEVCEFRRGLTYSKSDEADRSQNAVLRSTNIDLNTNTLDLADLRYLAADFPIPDDKRVVRDALLICMANGSKEHLGKVALIDRDCSFAFGGFMGLLLPKAIESRYLYHCLCSPTFKEWIGRLVDGANINNLRFSTLSEFSFPLPPLSVQRSIVARLDAARAECDRIGELARKGAEGCAALRAALLKEAFE